jgi:hypothetical protein
MTAIARRQKLHVAARDWRDQLRDALRCRRWAGRVDDDDHFRLCQLRGGKNGPQCRVLSRESVIRREHTVQRPQRMRCLHAVGFGEPRLTNQIGRAVGRSTVGVDHHGAQARKVTRERNMDRADDVLDRRGVVQRRESDEHVDLADSDQLSE